MQAHWFLWIFLALVAGYFLRPIVPQPAAWLGM